MKNKIAVIHQPDFLPYLGFFHRLLNADVFVILDHVQYVRGNQAWTNRDKIKTPNGQKWITVNVKKTNRETPINQIQISEVHDWRTHILNILRENYKDADYYGEIMPYIVKLFQFKTDFLVEFNMKSILLLMDLFEIHIPVIYSSSLSPVGHKNELLVDILKKLDLNKYLSGTGARDYFDGNVFKKAGIQVIWQEFSHPVYPQLYGEFIPNLSSIDLLFNCGKKQSRRLLREC